MTPARRTWVVRLTSAAKADFEEILRWTAEHLGETQAEAYAETLLDAIEALGTGPDAVGARARDELAKGVFTLHAARGGRKARHFIVFRVASKRGDRSVEILRILHDAMDLRRHLPPRDETE